MPGCIILATPNASGQIKKMQSANRLRQALHRGQGASFGAWLTMPGTNFARTVARCGFDWLCVDTEHGNIDGRATDHPCLLKARIQQQLIDSMLICQM